MHNDPTEAQIGFLSAWYGSHKTELLAVMDDFGTRSIHGLSSEDANTVLAIMTAQYGSPKTGEDADSHDDSHEDTEAHGDGDGEHRIEAEGNGHGEAGGEGEGEAEGGEGGEPSDGQPENPYREGSKEQIIAQALIDNGMDAAKAFEEIAVMIGTEPLVFEGNIGGGRAPLPLGDLSDKSSDKTQNGRAKKTINDVRRNLLNQPDGKNGEQNENESEGGNGNGFGGGGGEPDVQYEAELLLENLHEARAICEKMSADGEPFDTVGLRPFVHGPNMLAAGFPRLAVLDAMTMTWPREVRRELNGGKNLPEYDQRKFTKAKKIEPMPLDLIDKRLEPLREKTTGRSLYLPAMVALAETRTPIMQIGEKGTGKTTNAEHLAEALAERWDRPMPFGFASMTSGTSPGEFKGRITLQDFLPSLFSRIFEDGGVFLFDEMDAGDENLLTLLNSALANGEFVDQKNRIIKRHEHFVAVAAANTVGLGATSRYTGRNRLDAATLDRWAMGRMRVEFDVYLAEYIYWNNLRAAQAA